MTPFPDDNFAPAVRNRPLPTALFLMAALTAMIGAMSYLAVRFGTSGLRSENDAQQVILVDPLSSMANADTQSKATLVAARTTARDQASSMDLERDWMIRPAPGQVFLQVAVVDRGMAVATAEHLSRRGLTPYIASGANESEYRALVGGFRSSAEMTHVRESLRRAGFVSFVRKY